MAIFFSLHFAGRWVLRSFSALSRKRKSTPRMRCPNLHFSHFPRLCKWARCPLPHAKVTLEIALERGVWVRGDVSLFHATPLLSINSVDYTHTELTRGPSPRGYLSFWMGQFLQLITFNNKKSSYNGRMTGRDESKLLSRHHLILGHFSVILEGDGKVQFPVWLIVPETTAMCQDTQE